jgi:hypothetical protein
VLANHIWSLFGSESRADVNATFLQPFISFVTPTKTTISLNTESTYDWEASEWSVPVNIGVAQMLKLGPQILQVQVAARYWADSPPGGPDDWGVRIVITLLLSEEIGVPGPCRRTAGDRGRDLKAGQPLEQRRGQLRARILEEQER